MEIIVGSGFNNICFAMFQSEVIDRWGMPDKQYESDFDFCFLYFAWRCELCFDKEDNQLYKISFSHPETTIFNRPIINCHKDEVLNLFNSQLNDKLEIEDYQSFETYCFIDSCVLLDFKYNLLKTISIGNY